MAKINWGRLILGGLIAAIIMFFTDGFFHERVVGADWKAVYEGLRTVEPEAHGLGLAYLLSSNSAAGSYRCCSTPRCALT